MESSLVEQAKKRQRFLYLSSTNIDKEATAREIAARHGVKKGLVCVLQCVEPAWTFNVVKGVCAVPLSKKGKSLGTVAWACIVRAHAIASNKIAESVWPLLSPCSVVPGPSPDQG